MPLPSPYCRDDTTQLQRLEDRKRDPMTMPIVAQRVAEGETLRQIAQSMAIPYSLFHMWINQSEDRIKIYERALKVRADEEIHRALDNAYNEYERDDAGDLLYDKDGMLIRRDVRWARLQVATSFKAAEKWDADRFGARINKADVTGPVDEGVGEVARRLAQAFAAKDKFISRSDLQSIDDVEDLRI